MSPETTQKNLRVWIYTRYSTDKQSQKSIEDQLTECQRFCARNGWRVAHVLRDPELTGFIDLRPGYQELLAAIENREVDVIVAENIDRIVRDGEHSAALEKSCTFHDVQIWTIQEGKVGPMQLALKSLMSGEMRRTVALQAHRGLAGNVAKGRSAGGLSYGYEIARDHRGDRIVGELCIVDHEAAIVRRIMSEYADGKTPQKIASDLNADGIPSPSGTAWRQNTINGNLKRGTGIINNELYIGVRVWNRLEYRLHPKSQKRVSRRRPREEWVVAEVPLLRIADDDLWDRVKQRQMGLRSPCRTEAVAGTPEAKPYSFRRAKYLLSGLLFCRCGGRLTIAGTGKKRYYCERAKQLGPSKCAGMTGLPQLEAEAAVLAGMKKDLMQAAAVAAFRDGMEKEFKKTSEAASEEKAAVEKRLRKVDKQIGNATSAIMAGMNSPALLQELSKAEEQKADLIARIDQLRRPPLEIPKDLDRRFADLVRNLETVLSKPDLIVQAADVMKTLVEKIVVKERPEGGHILDLQGNLARMLKASAPNLDWPNDDLFESSRKLVAGVGFEPTTFRL